MKTYLFLEHSVSCQMWVKTEPCERLYCLNAFVVLAQEQKREVIWESLIGTLIAYNGTSASDNTEQVVNTTNGVSERKRMIGTPNPNQIDTIG